jgi:SAM-dependent methyltransferase
MLLSHEAAERMGLRSLRDERCDAVLRHCRGRLLDVGCGDNRLVRRHGLPGSVGIDVHDFGGGATIVRDAGALPFPDGSFDTVSFVASLNHIPNRGAALREARRVLAPGGALLDTMLSPFVGALRHRLSWWDRDQRERGMKAGELPGMSPAGVTALAQGQGFRLELRIRFVLGLNSLYVFRRDGA